MLHKIVSTILLSDYFLPFADYIRRHGRDMRLGEVDGTAIEPIKLASFF